MGDNKKKIKINWTRVATPSILGIYVVIALFLVYLSGNFLKKQFDRVIQAIGRSDATQSSTGLDFSNYQVVATKIGLAQLSHTSTTLPSISNQVIATSSTAFTSTSSQINNNTIATSSNDASELIGKDLKIKIYNTTKIAGLAGQLKNGLVELGFENVSSGNLSPIYATTTIQFKDIYATSLQLTEIKNLVLTKYQIIEDSLPANDEFDIIVMIGRN